MRISKAAGVTLLCLMVIAGARRVAADEIIDRVMAVAAGDVIMLSDVRAARALGTVDPGNAPDPDRAVLVQLMDRALVLNEVNRYAPPEPATQDVDHELARIRARFSSREAFDQAVARFGGTEAQLRESLREDLRIRAYLAQRFVAETPEQRQAVIDEWVSGLRRRAEILDPGASDRRP